MTERIKVYQEEREGLESNIAVFMWDFWSYESGSNFREQTGNKRSEGGSVTPVPSKTLTIMWCLGEAKKRGKGKVIREESSKVLLLNIYDLLWLDFMAYQPFWVI